MRKSTSQNGHIVVSIHVVKKQLEGLYNQPTECVPALPLKTNNKQKFAFLFYKVPLFSTFLGNDKEVRVVVRVQPVTALTVNVC